MEGAAPPGRAVLFVGGQQGSIIKVMAKSLLLSSHLGSALPSQQLRLPVLRLFLYNQVISWVLFLPFPPCCHPRANLMLASPPQVPEAAGQLVLTSLPRQPNNLCRPAQLHGRCFHGRWGGGGTGLGCLPAPRLNWLEEPLGSYPTTFPQPLPGESWVSWVLQIGSDAHSGV